MKKLILISVSVLLIHLAQSCVEPYDVVTDSPESMLVVDGLITNQEKHHQIKLSQTTAYTDGYTFVPERFAIVYIRDEQENTYRFREHEPGHYFSIEPFSGERGQSYTLYIETSAGDLYESDPQVIMPSIKLDTLHGNLIEREMMLPNNDGELDQRTVAGVEVFADVHNYNEQNPKFRFELDVLVQFIKIIDPEDPDSPRDYCRLRVEMNNLFNLTIPESNTEAGSSMQHDLAFIPRSREFYQGLYIPAITINRRALIVDQYSLNDDAYRYYTQFTEQLAADGSLFDPIAVQLEGNIHCINDPDKKALGFFEASGFHSETFALSPEPLTPHFIFLQKTHDLSHLPHYDCNYEMPPSLWIY